MESIYTTDTIAKICNCCRQLVGKFAKELFPEKKRVHGVFTVYTKDEAEKIIENIEKTIKRPLCNTVKYKDDKIAVILISGYDVIIDIENLDDVINLYWRINRDDSKYKYFQHRIKKNKKEKGVLLHRFIMNAQKGIIVDHINGNTLDNRKCNLRLCNISQNNCNRKISSHNTSGYKGVYLHNKKWVARIVINYKNYFLGVFDTPEKAYTAYCKAAKELHGEFARLA